MACRGANYCVLYQLFLYMVLLVLEAATTRTAPHISEVHFLIYKFRMENPNKEQLNQSIGFVDDIRPVTQSQGPLPSIHGKQRHLQERKLKIEQKENHRKEQLLKSIQRKDNFYEKRQKQAKQLRESKQQGNETCDEWKNSTSKVRYQSRNKPQATQQAKHQYRNKIDEVRDVYLYKKNMNKLMEHLNHSKETQEKQTVEQRNNRQKTASQSHETQNTGKKTLEPIGSTKKIHNSVRKRNVTSAVTPIKEYKLLSHFGLSSSIVNPSAILEQLTKKLVNVIRKQENGEEYILEEYVDCFEDIMDEIK